MISNANDLDGENSMVEAMLDNGMDFFHVRKPYFSRNDLRCYIERFQPHYLKKLVVHSYHTLALEMGLAGIHISNRHRKEPFKTWLRIRKMKFRKPGLKYTIAIHSIPEVKSRLIRYNYLILSPVFDSITKKNYKSTFVNGDLKKMLERTKRNVYALGGVDVDKIQMVKELGFKGVALMGAIWQNSDPVNKFIEIKNACS